MTVVTTASESRRDRKKASARRHILDTAIELFSRDGISAVTIDQIAAAADVGKGTIYNYFDTKESIVVAFMADLERKVQAKVHRLNASDKPLEAILTEFIRFQMRQKRPYHQFVRVFLAQIFTHTNHIVPYLAEMQKAIDPPLEALFSSLQERGLLRSDIAVSELTLIFKTIHMGLSALWAVEGPPFKHTERVLAQEMKLFCEGITANR